MGTVEPNDAELIARVRARDTAAFALLYDRHSRMAFGLAYRLLNDPSAAEDVVQEAFLSLWRQSGTFRPERAAVKTWLLSIVHHRAVDRLRSAANRELSDATLEGLPEPADDNADVERQVGQSLEAATVRRALVGLPLEQRRAIELAYFQGLSHSEIARLLDVPLGTVKGRLRMGMQKMRSVLAPAGGQEMAGDAR